MKKYIFFVTLLLVQTTFSVTSPTIRKMCNLLFFTIANEDENMFSREIIDILLRNKVDINEKIIAQHKKTLLTYAVEKSNNGLIQFLLMCGAKPTIEHLELIKVIDGESLTALRQLKGFMIQQNALHSYEEYDLTVDNKYAQQRRKNTLSKKNLFSKFTQKEQNLCNPL